MFRIFDPGYNGSIRFTDLLIAFSMSMKGTGKILDELHQVLTFWCQNIIHKQAKRGSVTGLKITHSRISAKQITPFL